MIVELHEQLLDQERELDERENALLTKELESSNMTTMPGCMLLPLVGSAL
jgi:hypothetical protein